MAEQSAIEQRIGYLKLIFGVLLVTDISLIGWLFSSEAATLKIITGTAAVFSLFAILFAIHRRIERLIDDLRRA